MNTETILDLQKFTKSVFINFKSKYVKKNVIKMSRGLDLPNDKTIKYKQNQYYFGLTFHKIICIWIIERKHDNRDSGL